MIKNQNPERGFLNRGGLAAATEEVLKRPWFSKSNIGDIPLFSPLPCPGTDELPNNSRRVSVEPLNLERTASYNPHLSKNALSGSSSGQKSYPIGGTCRSEEHQRLAARTLSFERGPSISNTYATVEENPRTVLLLGDPQEIAPVPRRVTISSAGVTTFYGNERASNFQ